MKVIARNTTVSTESEQTTKLMLMCGVIFGPIFYLLIIIEILIQPEFDITKHPISLLALGDMGWMQTSNFILTGLLAILGGFGISLSSERNTSKWQSILPTVFGIGVILAAIFPTDPSFGFPPGTPENTSTTLSRTAMMHGVGFMTAFGSLTILCFVLGKHWVRQGLKRRGKIALLIGVITPLTIALGFAIPSATSILFALVGIPVFGLVNMANFYQLREFSQHRFTGIA